MGAAAVAGDGAYETRVAVGRVGRSYPVIDPCGTCRQLLLRFAPRASFLAASPDGTVHRMSVRASLPAPG
jgi:cytidine deaminase